MFCRSSLANQLQRRGLNRQHRTESCYLLLFLAVSVETNRGEMSIYRISDEYFRWIYRLHKSIVCRIVFLVVEITTHLFILFRRTMSTQSNFSQLVPTLFTTNIYGLKETVGHANRTWRAGWVVVWLTAFGSMAAQVSFMLRPVPCG